MRLSSIIKNSKYQIFLLLDIPINCIFISIEKVQQMVWTRSYDTELFQAQINQHYQLLLTLYIHSRPVVQPLYDLQTWLRLSESLREVLPGCSSPSSWQWGAGQDNSRLWCLQHPAGFEGEGSIGGSVCFQLWNSK